MSAPGGTQAIQRRSRRAGGPLMLLGLVGLVWIVGRVAMWQNPLTLAATVQEAESSGAMAQAQTEPQTEAQDVEFGQLGVPAAHAASANNPATSTTSTSNAHKAVWQAGVLMPAARVARPDNLGSSSAHLAPVASQLARHLPRDVGGGTIALATPSSDSAAQEGTSNEAPATQKRRPDRWSMDVFAFFRDGSASASILQGRLPVYGASQLSANLQYRLAPESRRDPRLFARAYRALVTDGETEGAIGASVRPLGTLPIRIAAEARVVHNRFGTDVRPAAFAISELAPQNLPFDLQLETYGAAGYVGGKSDTYFAEGQARVMREALQLRALGDAPLRLSIGGGAWAGVQKDASRLDVGPSLQLDLKLGRMPARLSVDWRERVSGDAKPDSGLAATLSTRF